MTLLLRICWSCLLVLLLTEKHSVWYLVLITALWVSKWKTLCLVRGSRQAPGGDHGFLQCAWRRASLGNSQLDKSQTVLPTRSQPLLTSGFLLL